MVGAESQRAGSGSGALSGGPGSPRSLSPQRQDRGDGSPRLIVRVCAALAGACSSQVGLPAVLLTRRGGEERVPREAGRNPRGIMLTEAFTYIPHRILRAFLRDRHDAVLQEGKLRPRSGLILPRSIQT